MSIESGETMFERFSRALGLASSRIPEAHAAGERRPDFLVVGDNGIRFLAEVKRISPNREEAAQISRLERGETCAMGGTPGDRIRELIAKANRQLKPLVSPDLPGVLVAFNPDLLLRRHTDPYNILTAMRGLDEAEIVVPLDSNIPPAFVRLRSGGKKRMTSDFNTTTAAIVCPREAELNKWTVEVYHNRHALPTFPVEALAHPDVRHWRMSEDEQTWIHIATES